MSWRAVWRQAASDMLHSADASAELALRVLESQQLMVERLNDLVRGLSDAEIRAREPELHARLATLLEGLPLLVTGYLLDREGMPLLSGNVMPVPHDMRFGDRDFFAGLRAPGAPRTFVGQVYQGRVDGALFFAVAQRRSGSGNPPAADGFDGVVNISVDPAAIGEGLARLLAAPQDTVAMIRRDGTILARVPVLRRPGQELRPDNPLRAAMQAGSPRGVTTGISAVDGVWRLTAYRQLEGWPVYAAAGRSRGAILFEWASLMALQLAIAVPALVALLALGRLAVERARRDATDRAALAENAVRSAAAAALRASEARYRTLSEVAADVVWSRLDTGAMAAPQPSWEAFTGQTPSQYRGFGWQDAIHPADREAAAERWQAATVAGRSYAAELRLRHRDGGWRHCLVRAAPVPEAPGADAPVEDALAPGAPEGRPRLWVGAHIDVTPLREAESRQRFLMQEIDHRAKNALSVVQAVIRLTRAGSRQDFVTAVEGRVAALARAQTVLARGRWAGADLRVLLEGELAPSSPRPRAPAPCAARWSSWRARGSSSSRPRRSRCPWRCMSWRPMR
ncbi:HWE histidine kinase domain-containing protein [Paeniroseomonas aquatica]|uniref:HWE histidine kinase domain-containing protein n=1 Tax=Paeniroseomonas aquatica TaxID=373043 RepID=UPI0036102AA1